ncbi:hypothetical protein A3F06_00875 [candidate division TM6 bacterium RIFCSPHIGHO2_12_FULL_36_22]|nr:MAG: hypothetical protein A3F06_00875 [candidate division TM6 bacterium RIFCSPHIGHO2_12_FULL_36_22]
MIINFHTLLFIQLLLSMVNMPLMKYIQPPTITVIVHGSKMPDTIGKLLCVAYKFRYAPMGLSNAQYLDSTYSFHKLVNTLNVSDPDRFALRNTYLFGWNGKVNTVERRKAAELLYEELVELAQRYPQGAKLQIITHSHGGNVVLNLPVIQKDKPVKIIIDKLILLACPVQQQTAPNLTDPMFKKIIGCISKADVIQLLDLQGLHKENHAQRRCGSLFSKRRFCPQDNLVQVRIQSGMRDIGHIDFVRKPFITKLPQVLCVIDERWDEFHAQHPDNNIINIKDLT